jgi:hypothetical protein
MNNLNLVLIFTFLMAKDMEHFFHTFIGSGSLSSSLGFYATSAVASYIEVLNHSTSFMRVGVNFFETPVSDDILTSFHGS